MYPYRIESKQLRPDSGGPGKFRGGLGIEKIYRFLQPLSLMNKMDRTRCPPWGLAGGGAAQPAGGEVMRASGDRSVLRKGKMEMECDDVVVISSGGGGGHGRAYERDPVRVIRDVAEGYVSIDAAERDYGVVLRKDGSLDDEATSARRSALSSRKDRER